jgi:hypothetical protein
MSELYEIYEPTNDAYTIISKEGKVRQIIGTKEDLLFLRGVARVETPRDIKNSDIQNTILNLGKVEKKALEGKND